MHPGQVIIAREVKCDNGTEGIGPSEQCAHPSGIVPIPNFIPESMSNMERLWTAIASGVHDSGLLRICSPNWKP